MEFAWSATFVAINNAGWVSRFGNGNPELQHISRLLKDGRSMVGECSNRAALSPGGIWPWIKYSKAL